MRRSGTGGISTFASYSRRLCVRCRADECRGSEKIYTVRAPWEGRSRGLTQEFEAFALDADAGNAREKSGGDLGGNGLENYGGRCSPMWTRRGEELSWENVILVGADEMNHKKGHHYLTVFVDLQARRVLLAVEGKDAGVWKRFAEELGAIITGIPGRSPMVAIDMSPAYIEGIKGELGQCADRLSISFMWSARWWRRWRQCGAKRRGRTRAPGAVGKDQLVVAQESRSVDRQGRRSLEQLKDKPLVTGLAYAMRLELQQAYAADHRRAGPEPF